MNKKKLRLEAALEAFLKSDDRGDSKAVYEAMEYSLLGGGKRIRGLLTMLFCELCGGAEEESIPFACAIEMVQAYSLIHDDLPCMDDDNMRRGKPTNHKVFGEDIALLAGDSLLTKAFECMLSPKTIATAGCERAAKSAGLLAKFAGAAGMVGGQCMDLKSEGENLTLRQLEAMDMGKTVALIDAACQIGTVIGGGDEKALQLASNFAVGVGMAFQIRDDILDVVGDEQVLGKATGADKAQKKCNYVTLLGVEKATELVKDNTEKALLALSAFTGDSQELKALALSLVNRDC